MLLEHVHTVNGIQPIQEAVRCVFCTGLTETYGLNFGKYDYIVGRVAQSV